MEMHTVSIPSYWRTPFRHQINISFCRHICSVVLPRHIQFRTHFPVVSSLPCPDAIMITTIMHQHACAANMIGMEILDLEVVDGDRGFQQFMLDCLDHDILAVAPDEDVPCAQIAGCRPTPDRYIGVVVTVSLKLVRISPYMLSSMSTPYPMSALANCLLSLYLLIYPSSHTILPNGQIYLQCFPQKTHFPPCRIREFAQ